MITLSVLLAIVLSVGGLYLAIRAAWWLACLLGRLMGITD